LLRFPWRGDRVGEPELWREFDDQFYPDGMAFHQDRLYLTGSDGDRIAVLDLDGSVAEMIAVPSRSIPTNLCFQGDTMWVTFGISGELAAYRL
jgi:sugar lactone lactonase YvrE